MPTSADEVWVALALGAVPSAGLLIGAIAGSFSRLPHQPHRDGHVGRRGMLLAGVSLKVAADAIRIAGPVPAALSLLLGAAVFSASNALLARFGAAIASDAASDSAAGRVAAAWQRRRHRVGNALDAVPEAMVLESLCGIRSSPSRWCSRSQWATFPWRCRAPRGCGPPAAVTPTSSCSGVRSPSGPRARSRPGMLGSVRSVRRGHRGCRPLAPEHCSRWLRKR